jgi:predicted transcriptional regulator
MAAGHAHHDDPRRSRMTMPTTTIRIEADLKARLAAAAERAGKSSHAFITDAVAQAVEQEEWEAEMDRVAEQRWSKIVASGRTVAWEDAKVWIEARLEGKRPRKPAARKSGR